VTWRWEGRIRCAIIEFYGLLCKTYEEYVKRKTIQWIKIRIKIFYYHDVDVGDVGKFWRWGKGVIIVSGAQGFAWSPGVQCPVTNVMQTFVY
jgi:hypothetical protein